MKISKYIRAEHMSPGYVEENGGELKVTIAGTSEQHLWNEDRLVLSFEDEHPDLPLNVTNIKQLGKLFGHDTADWVGQGIILFLIPVTIEGQDRQGIRIRPPAGWSAKPRPAPRSAKEVLRDDEIPF